MRLVRLFQSQKPSFCQHLIGRDPHIDRKTKMAVNIVADISAPSSGEENREAMEV